MSITMCAQTEAEKMFEVITQSFVNCDEYYGSLIKSAEGKDRVITVKEPITDGVLSEHLVYGTKHIGVHILNRIGECKVGCIDFDRHEYWPHVKNLSIFLKEQFNIDCLIERSKGKGYHVWILFFVPIRAPELIKFLDHVIGKVIPSDVKYERNPKQSALTIEKTFGGFVFLPLQHDYVQKGRTVFVDLNDVPYPDQIELIKKAGRVAPIKIYRIVDKLEAMPAKLKLVAQGEINVRNKRFKLSEPPPCIKKLENGVTKGNRDISAFQLSCFLNKCNVSKDRIAMIMNKWNDRNDPPLSNFELEKCIKQGEKYMLPCQQCSLENKKNCMNQDQRKVLGKYPPLLKLDEYLEQDIPEPETYWGEIISKRTLLVVSAPPKGYKSFFCLQLALSLAIGESHYLQIPIKGKYRTLYFDGEIGAAHLKKRLSKLVESKPNYADGIFYPVSLTGTYIDNPDDWNIFEQYIKMSKVEIIFIDNMSTFVASSDENSASSLKPFFHKLLELAEEYGIAIILIHHNRKTVSSNALNDMRGSGVIAGFCTAHISITKVDDVNRVSFVLRNGEPVEDKFIKLGKDLWFEEVSGRSIDVINIYENLIKQMMTKINKPIPQHKLINQLIEEFGYSEKTWRNGLKALKDDGIIKTIKAAQGIQLQLFNNDAINNKEEK